MQGAQRRHHGRFIAAREVRVGLTVAEFVNLSPRLVHFAPRGLLRLEDGLLTARQIVELNASRGHKVWARYVAEPEWRQVDARSLVERSRFLRGAGDVGSNVLVRALADENRVFFLGNNSPLGDGSCVGTTVALTDNRTGDSSPSREGWFKTLNSMFWFFDARRVDANFVNHLASGAERHGWCRIALETAHVPPTLLEERLRLSRINGGVANGVARRGTATYKRLHEWSGRWPPKELGFWDGIPADSCRELIATGALTVADYP